MASITEQFSATAKSQLEAQFKIFNTFASGAMQGAEKVIALNITAARMSVAKSSELAKRLLEAKDPKEFFATVGQPNLEGVIAYGRELAGIAATAQSELIESARHAVQQATSLATAPTTLIVKTPATAPASASPSTLSAAISSTVSAPASEPTPAAPPKAAKAAAKPAAKPKPVAAAIATPIAAAIAAVADTPVAVVATVKPTFPAPPPKPMALAPAAKPAKLKSVSSKATPAPGKQLDMISGSKGKK